MANSKNHSSKVKDEDIVIYKIMAAMVIVAAVLCVLIVLYNKYQVISHFMGIYTAVYYTAIIGAIGTVVCGIAAVAVRKQQKLCKVLSAVTVCLLIVAVCSVIMRVYSYEGIRWLFIAFPAGLVLYILYLIYQREFFVLSLQSVVSGIGFYVLHEMGTTCLRPWAVVLLALFLVVTTAAAALTGPDGLAGIKGIRVRLCNEHKHKVLLLITSVLCIIGWVLTVLVGGTVAFVCAGVVLLWLIAMACYFTIKLV
jgi:hypothetical protein